MAERTQMTTMTDPDCPKCHGAGGYMYDHNHGKPCELCCKHDTGWWQLREHYGANNGKWACRLCGELRNDNAEAMTWGYP